MSWQVYRGSGIPQGSPVSHLWLVGSAPSDVGRSDKEHMTVTWTAAHYPAESPVNFTPENGVTVAGSVDIGKTVIAPDLASRRVPQSQSIIYHPRSHRPTSSVFPAFLLSERVDQRQAPVSANRSGCRKMNSWIVSLPAAGRRAITCLPSRWQANRAVR